MLSQEDQIFIIAHTFLFHISSLASCLSYYCQTSLFPKGSLLNVAARLMDEAGLDFNCVQFLCCIMPILFCFTFTYQLLKNIFLGSIDLNKRCLIIFQF